MKLKLFLIHGAFQGGFVWRSLFPRLAGMGHMVCAPTLSGNTLTEHINQVSELIRAHAPGEEKIVLLGHSYGSLVVTGVAKRLAPQKIQGLIYLDAPIPFDSNGEPQSLLDILGYAATEFFMQNTKEGLVNPFSPQAFGLDDSAHSEIIALHRSQALDCFTEKGPSWSPDDRPAFPITYIQCAPNEFTDQQVVKAKALKWYIATIPESGHCPMITHPGPLLELLSTKIFPKIESHNTEQELCDLSMGWRFK